MDTLFDSLSSSPTLDDTLPELELSPPHRKRGGGRKRERQTLSLDDLLHQQPSLESMARLEKTKTEIERAVDIGFSEQIVQDILKTNDSSIDQDSYSDRDDILPHHPGVYVFSSSRFMQLFNLPDTGQVKQLLATQLDPQHITSLNTVQLNRLLTSSVLDLALASVTDRRPVMDYLLEMVSVETDAYLKEEQYMTLTKLIAQQKMCDVLWMVKTEKLLYILENYGASVSQLYPRDLLQRLDITQDFTPSTVPAKKPQRFATQYDTTNLQYVLQCVQCSVKRNNASCIESVKHSSDRYAGAAKLYSQNSSYSSELRLSSVMRNNSASYVKPAKHNGASDPNMCYTDTQLFMFLVMGMCVALDVRLVEGIMSDTIHRYLHTIISAISQHTWQQKFAVLCDVLSLIAQHHHDMVYLLELLPIDDRGCALKQHIAYHMLHRRFNSAAFQLGSVAECCDLTQLSQLASRCAVEVSSQYELLSCVEMFAAAAGNQKPRKKYKADLDKLIATMREFNRKFKDVLGRVEHSKIKNRITQVTGKWSMFAASCGEMQTTLFRYISNTPTTNSQLH